MNPRYQTMDANEAVAHVAYRLNEVIAIYPITPSSSMGEWADAWAAERIPNLWGTVPSVVEMQSEAGVAGAVHGALQTGSLTTTFTASQGLLLMLPNMYKIAGELTSTVFHVAARTIASHALSIFGDHSDVMACRPTGYALLSSASVQEAMDFALISQAAALESRIPFLHFFDGFRTSHEVAKIQLLSETEMRKMIVEEWISQHRARALTPDAPVLRGTTQDPDVFFQARERSNPFYLACPRIVEGAMARFAQITGRHYQLFEYHGAPHAERVMVLMASACETAHETVDALLQKGEKVGILKVRLYRPFDAERFVNALPASVKSLAILDRTKEPGSGGEPLYLDCVNALREAERQGWRERREIPDIVGGRYGLSSKEFTPAMVRGIFDHLTSKTPKNSFTIGIVDDVTLRSLPYDPQFSTESDDVFRAIFYGLGSDGTVGANRNSIKIIGEKGAGYAQGYFVHDSKKSGSVTISHLRFSPRPIRSAYLIGKANFIACHHESFLGRYEVLEHAAMGGTFLLNTPHEPDQVWNHLPPRVREDLVLKKMRCFVVDASRVAREAGIGGRINTVMQACFFAISGILPKEEALAAIQDAVQKTYRKKGEEIVRMNLCAIDRAVDHLFEVRVTEEIGEHEEMPPPVSEEAPSFVSQVLGRIMAGKGNSLPVSAMPRDGTFPTGTARWEKRNTAEKIPFWDPEQCIQCGRCVLLCPHSAIRAKAYAPHHLNEAPSTFLSAPSRDREWKKEGLRLTLQVAPEDCTGCAICAEVCPAQGKTAPHRKALWMDFQDPARERERAHWNFFLNLPEVDRSRLRRGNLAHQQFLQPLFEFPGACAGCGETPYLKLLSQLFGDRALIANATGCSSIYGGNLPTTPWTVNGEGRGPAWANSLFEDNAEFGFGFRISLDKQREIAAERLRKLAPVVGDDLVAAILSSKQKDEAEIQEQRRRIAALKETLRRRQVPEAAFLLPLVEALVRKSVWIVGGDGWAYDIGFGGLDHVLADDRDVNILVLDTEEYSNTGGQMSKSTPRGAVAKFAASGKEARKKDLGLIAMSYGHVYVASVALGANNEHTLRAFLEAEAYEGPSLILAYSHCIAHGICMSSAAQNQKAAVQSGQWLLYRHHPDRARRGENPLQLDSPKPQMPVETFFQMENRFKILGKTNPELARQLAQQAQHDAHERYNLYSYLASYSSPSRKEDGCENVSLSNADLRCALQIQ